jgi:hypothetical protein
LRIVTINAFAMSPASIGCRKHCRIIPPNRGCAAVVTVRVVALELEPLIQVHSPLEGEYF